MRALVFVLVFACAFLSACGSEPTTDPTTDSTTGQTTDPTAAQPDDTAQAAPVTQPTPSPSTGQSQLKFEGKDPLYPEMEVQLKVVPNEAIKVGEILTFSFKVKVLDPKWHIYSSRRDGTIAYNPTEMVLYGKECKGIGKVGEMSENKKSGEVFDDVMGGLIREFKDSEVTFTQKLKVSGPEVALVGEFSGQICTIEGMCKFYKFLLEWSFQAQ